MVTALRVALRSDLKAAMTACSIVEVSAIRSLLTALDDAEAVPVPAHVGASSPVGEHAVGVASTEVDRRRLSAAEVGLVVAGQIEERRAAATLFDEVGEAETAGRLRAEIDVLDRYVAAAP